MMNPQSHQLAILYHVPYYMQTRNWIPNKWTKGARTFMDINSNGLTLIPNDDLNCFACSPHNVSGLRMKFYANDKTVFSWITIPNKLAGFKEVVHGGITVTMLDEITAWATLYFIKKAAVTKSIKSDFLRMISTDQQLRLEGRILEVKGEREAIAEGLLYNSEEKLCAKAITTMAILDEESFKKFGKCDEHLMNNLKNVFESSKA